MKHGLGALGTVAVSVQDLLTPNHLRARLIDRLCDCRLGEGGFIRGGWRCYYFWSGLRRPFGRGWISRFEPSTLLALCTGTACTRRCFAERRDAALLGACDIPPAVEFGARKLNREAQICWFYEADGDRSCFDEPGQPDPTFGYIGILDR